jgi:hypothetical protein
VKLLEQYEHHMRFQFSISSRDQFELVVNAERRLATGGTQRDLRHRTRFPFIDLLLVALWLNPGIRSGP